MQFPRTGGGACQSLLQLSSLCPVCLGLPRPFVPQFAFASPQSQALHRLPARPPLSFGSPGLMPQTTGAPSEPRPRSSIKTKQKRKEKRGSASVRSTRSRFYRPQTNEPHWHSWHLSLAFIMPCSTSPHLSLAFVSPCFSLANLFEQLLCQ